MSKRAHRRGTDKPADRFADRRARYKSVLETFKLWPIFRLMPREYQEQFFAAKFPDPVLRFDETFPQDRQHGAWRRELEEQFRESTIHCGAVPVKVRDYLSVLLSVAVMVHSTNSKKRRWDAPMPPEEVANWLKFSPEMLDFLVPRFVDAIWPAWHDAVLWPLVARSRLDARLYTLHFEHGKCDNGKQTFTLTAGSTTAEQRRVEIDGVSRPAYRVGGVNEWFGPKWCNWTGDPSDLAGKPTGLPVFVQSHALHRLRERLSLPKLLPSVEHWLAMSLNNPNVIERTGRDLLVEYRIQEYRAGYLIVRPMRDMMLVRTFKFLTMENTPEARAFKRELKLARRDVEWLGLDTLTAFTQTDLADDDELYELLEKCGCAHLPELSYESFNPNPKPLAAEMRKYLRLAA